MNTPFHKWAAISAAAILTAAVALSASAAGPRLEQAFKRPPASARPWVYWFWLNGNITSHGITADLEAMKRVGIGGVLIMEVDQGAPLGPVGFMSAEWRALFKHVASEAKRLGLEVNMNNDAGWNGSGGPWIKPEQSMQKVVVTETNLAGPRRFEGTLVQPQTVAGFYRDIAVLAAPTPGAFRIGRINAKAAYEVAHVGVETFTNLPPEMVIERERIVDLTAKMDANGRLTWDVPPSQWTVLRFGHTSTGVENAPAPVSGRGLECDKLSKEGIEANFAGMMAKLAADNGLVAADVSRLKLKGDQSGLTSAATGLETRFGLVATHIDSWENGSQNWTARMRAEFRQRRGYDLLPFLPAFTGRVVGSHEITERFLWDSRRTISELVVENYAGHMRALAHKHGLRFTVEAYGSPCDNLPYAGESDEPMGEFWIPSGGAIETCRGMASAGHVYGKRIVGAEAFTAADQEKWLEHPAAIKALGDRAFCEGINRFVFHRYALQPWGSPRGITAVGTDARSRTDIPRGEDRRPGMTMGPWGQHYERTQTWWDWTAGWHEYLARCQFMLRQGHFVADICYLQAEASPQGLGGHERNGYDWDDCPAEVVLTRMSVKDGRLMLPDGMSYRVLALPDSPTMTPALLRKIKELVAAGATVIGPRPAKSPSLSGYPQCDEEVKRIADELWGDGVMENRSDATRTTDSSTPTLQHSTALFPQRRFGAGRIVWGITPEKVLAQAGVPADFTSRPRLRAIHRATDDAEIYFVANSKPHDVEAVCTFRMSGRQPELWWPDTGRVEAAAAWEQEDGSTSLPLRLEPAGSVFVVFRKGAQPADPVVALSRDGKPLLPPATPTPKITVQRAVYGVLDDPPRTRDVRAKVQRLVDNGEDSFKVARLAEGDDPAQGAVKTAVIEYTVGDRRITVTGRDADTVHLPEFAPSIVVQRAVYGVLDDPKRTRDMRTKVQRLVDAGEYSFQVARLAEGDDPAFLVVKTLIVDYTLDGKPVTATGTDPETLYLAQPPVPVVERVAEVRRGADGKPQFSAWQPGRYEVKTASGKTQRIDVAALPSPLEVRGPWEVRFAPGWGAPGKVTFDALTDWSKHPDPGVKYFSGEATYRTTFRWNHQSQIANRKSQISLDLGKVAVMASVKLNGQDLGTRWKPPFTVDITRALKRGENTLEVRVVNLWINRMIGDEQLPEDSERNPDGTLKKWPPWLQQGKPSPAGRYTFTSWRLWKKDAALRESGLLGPVTLRVAEQVTMSGR
ncbi:MAG: hypothetical protein HYY24_29930 [Verrucomicrobia bacterium]|nr:hypothetical protein [Verrucomicrobiota bacterium]